MIKMHKDEKQMEKAITEAWLEINKNASVS